MRCFICNNENLTGNSENFTGNNENFTGNNGYFTGNIEIKEGVGYEKGRYI